MTLAMAVAPGSWIFLGVVVATFFAVAYGYFTRTTLSTTNTGGAGTGPNFGASVVSLVG